MQAWAHRCAPVRTRMQVDAESYKCLQKRHVRRNDLTQVFRSSAAPPSTLALVGIKIREKTSSKQTPVRFSGNFKMPDGGFRPGGDVAGVPARRKPVLLLHVNDTLLQGTSQSLAPAGMYCRGCRLQALHTYCRCRRRLGEPGRARQLLHLFAKTLDHPGRDTARLILT